MRVIGNMKKQAVISLLIVIVGLLSQNLSAQVGLTGVPFLRIEPEARSASLGNTGVSDSRSFYAGFWNPSILAHQKEYSFGITHSDWLPGLSTDLSFDNFSSVIPLGAKSTISIDALYFNLGSQSNMDASGNYLGDYSNYEFTVSSSYGYALSSRWAVGLNLRYISSNIADGVQYQDNTLKPGTGLSFGIGTLYSNTIVSTMKRRLDTRFGLSLNNMGSGVDYGDNLTLEPLPTQLRMGYSFDLFTGDNMKHRISLYNDYSKNLARSETIVENGVTRYEPVSSWNALTKGWGSVDVYTGDEWVALSFVDQWSMGTGVEYALMDKFMLRGGYYTENQWNGGRNYLTTGVGLHVANIKTDISYLVSTKANDPMANTVRVSVRLNLKKEKKKRIPKYVPPTFIQPDSTISELILQQLIMPDIELDTTRILIQSLPELTVNTLADSINAISREMVNFDVMSSRINPDQAAVLLKFVELLKIYEDAYIDIKGYTDSSGNLRLNTMLSEARSRAVWLYMVEQGIAWERIDIEGLADSDPLADNDSDEGMAQNRRASIVLDSLKMATTEILVDIKGQSVTNPDDRGVFVSGNPLRFMLLDVVDENTFINNLGGILTWLEQNPNESIEIGYHINYPSSGNSFERELEKARSEKIKSLFIRSGINPNRLIVITKAQTFNWQNRMEGLMDFSQQEYLIIRVKD